jgi:hypothetical protein
MFRAALFTSACFSLFVPALASAAGICWIDKITKAAGGVEVHFVPHANLSVSGQAARNLYVSDGVVRQSTNHSEAHLVLAEGQVVAVSVIPEDMCSIVATAQGGQLGVLAHSANNMAGQHIQTTDFYPVE